MSQSIAAQGAAHDQPFIVVRDDETSPAATTYLAANHTLDKLDVLRPDHQRPRERFIPITRFALMDRLMSPEAWGDADEASAARRFFNYLDYWRHQLYGARLLELEQTYEPFSPDTDLLLTRKYTAEELRAMQARFVKGMQEILAQANYERIDPAEVTRMMAAASHYGLDLSVDFSLFEECLIYYRGASTRKDQRRSLRKFMRKEEFDVPVFQRLFLLFKLKPLERRVREIMEKEKVSRQEALRIAKRQRAHLPASVNENDIYMKLFKNIPRADVEMVFPNTVVKFRLLDKITLGGTGAVGVGMSTFAAIGKVGLLLTNPIVAGGAIIGFGATLFRQVMKVVNTKQRYMVIMAQNLYFHAMADNRGVMIKLIDRAAEEDVKEEILLYCVLAKEKAHRSELKAIDQAIERYLSATFGVDVDFDLEDALSRLKADGLVTEDKEGYLHTLPPREAARHLDSKWDLFLDTLPDMEAGEGREVRTPERKAVASAATKMSLAEHLS